ncbi:tryptophan--tRNA ligase, partial [Staphylococcus epidermidis]
MKKENLLTGDRPTGKLHIGHYIGSLKKRVEIQDQFNNFIMIADQQALTDNAKNPKKIQNSLIEVILDYLSVGINPIKSNIFVQSQIPELSELTMYYLNLVSVSRLKRNPTVKNEMKEKNFGDSVPTGFFIYPVSQAADITAFKASIVPVGEDQIPMIEQTNEIVKTFNNIYKQNVLKR